MNIEIWSDIVCPFCYIGKRNLEAALAQFPQAATVKLTWKSFQLDPDLPKDDAYRNVYHYLSERKGMSLPQVKQMTAHVEAVGKQAGVDLDFDHAIVANTFDAHRLVHLADQHGRATDVTERLFRSYFTDGLHIGARETLIGVGVAAGLNRAAIEQLLDGNGLTDEVEKDIQEAHILGIRSVPFFVFDRRFAVSGAQPVSAFLETLQKALPVGQRPFVQVTGDDANASSCRPDGTCD